MAQEDPVLRSARREMIVTFVIFLCALAYTITYSYRNGYNRDPQSLTFVFGFPDWIFYGVIAPWAVCIVLCWVVSTLFFRDEDLGVEREDPADA